MEANPYRPPDARVADVLLGTEHAPTRQQVFQALFVSPLAVIPVSLLVSVVVNILDSPAKSLWAGLGLGVLVAIWGVLIAYPITFVYGLLAYWILRRMGLVNLPVLLGASALPFVVFGLAVARTPAEWTVPALGLPFGAAVAFLFWYVLLGRPQRLRRSPRSTGHADSGAG